MVQFEIAAIYSTGPDQADGNEVLGVGGGCLVCEGGRVRGRQEMDSSLSD